MCDLRPLYRRDMGRYFRIYVYSQQISNHNHQEEIIITHAQKNLIDCTLIKHRSQFIVKKLCSKSRKLKPVQS